MRVLVINPSSGKKLDGDYNMPLTIYHLAGVLREDGHDVIIIDEMLYVGGKMDCSLDEAMKKYTQDRDAIIFTSNTFNWAKGLDDCKKLRAAGYQGIIIAGGVHLALAYEHIMNKFSEYIDFIMIGDAEINLLPLLKCIENGKSYDDVPGIVYKKNGMLVNHKTIVEKKLRESKDGPAYDLVPKEAYKSISFECSRGCLGNCSFCSIPYTRSWRTYSLEHITHTLEMMLPHLNKFPGRPTIITTDDCFTTNAERAIEILKIFKSYNMQDYNVHLEARVMDLKNDKLLEILTEFPNVDLELGVECGYDRGLKAVHKPLTVKMLYDCCDKLCDYGLERNIYTSFIVGMPHESFEECYMTINTAKDLFNKYEVFSGLSFWAPLPSESFKLLQSKVPDIDYSIFDNVDWYENQEFFYKCHPNLTKEENDQLMKDTYIIANQLRGG